MSTSAEMSNLIEQLAARKSAQANGQAALRRWQQDLAALAEQVEQWLAPARAQGLLDVSVSQAGIHEPDHGAYEVPVVNIRFPDSAYYVSLQARGLEFAGAVVGERGTVAGMYGRVDLCSATGDKVSIFRDKASGWHIVGALPGRDGFQHPLDEASFALALQWLLP